jgi:hypothetical protein
LPSDTFASERLLDFEDLLLLLFWKVKLVSWIKRWQTFERELREEDLERLLDRRRLDERLRDDFPPTRVDFDVLPARFDEATGFFLAGTARLLLPHWKTNAPSKPTNATAN